MRGTDRHTDVGAVGLDGSGPVPGYPQDGLLQTGSPWILDKGRQPVGAFVFDMASGLGRL